MTTATDFNAVSHYASCLDDEAKSMPIAAIETLAMVVERSKAETMFELLEEIEATSSALKREAFNPISLSAGTALFTRFVSLQRPALDAGFSAHKKTLAKEAR